MIQYEELFKNKAFASMDENKKKLFIELAEKVKGKNTMEAISIVSDYAPKLNAGKPLTALEQEAMLEALKSGMNDHERRQLEQVMSMMKMMKAKGI